MYEGFINQLKMYAKVIRILSKGYLPISLLLPSKLNKISLEEMVALQTTKRDYDLGIKSIKRLYLYYEMKLVTFGIDDQRNLIIKLPVFVQPYTQQHLINEQAQSYIYIFENIQTLHCIEFRNIYFIENTRTGFMQKDRL